MQTLTQKQLRLAVKLLRQERNRRRNIKRVERQDKAAEKAYRLGRRVCGIRNHETYGKRYRLGGRLVCICCYGLLTGNNTIPKHIGRIPHKTRRAPNLAPIIGGQGLV